MRNLDAAYSRKGKAWREEIYLYRSNVSEVSVRINGVMVDVVDVPPKAAQYGLM